MLRRSARASKSDLFSLAALNHASASSSPGALHDEIGYFDPLKARAEPVCAHKKVRHSYVGLIWYFAWYYPIEIMQLADK